MTTFSIDTPVPFTGPFSNYRALHMTVVQVSDITLPKKQPKIMRPEAVQHCARNMSRYGQIYPILGNTQNEVIAGFEFLAAAKLLSWTHVNVLQRTDLSDAECKVQMLAFAKTSELSDQDDRAVKFLLQEIYVYDPDLLDLTGFETAEIDIISETATVEEEDEQEEASPLPPDDDKITSRPGDIFDLGGHRILCGNALDEETHKILIAGATAQAVCTDPPYGFKINGHASVLGKNKHDDFAIGVAKCPSINLQTFSKPSLRPCLPTWH